MSVHGILLDAKTGKPLVGATISIIGIKSGTQSGIDGRFQIQLTTLPVRLLFTAVGYETKERNVKDTTSTIKVRMKAISTDLGQVIVVGKGAAKTKDIGASAVVSPGLYMKKSSVHELTYTTSSPSQVSNYQNIDKEMTVRATDDQYRIADTSMFNREGYDELPENRFLKATDNPLSTFSIDVDGASYSNVRRFLQGGQLPPAGSVRIEELINYFHYEYPQPAGEDPFSINTEMSVCPWNNQNKLLMIGLQGRKIAVDKLPPSNLVFLIDVSGSMIEPDKLPLVQVSLRMLVDQLREQDRVSLVVYAGNAGLVMPSTSGMEKEKIKAAIDRLEAGGSTAGGEGIQLAYEVAKQNFQPKGNNRVILCTDGDFNVGVSSDAALEKLIEQERTSGVFFTVLGFGTGNYQDSKMEKLADKGNGNHAYIDNIAEAKKVLVSEFGGTLFTIAKDVKLQVEFNPAKVQAYRLIGYENRMLAKEDFNNDKKDAGELGSGHTVTAIYEIVPAGAHSPFIESTDPLKYQQIPGVLPATSNEMVNIKFRYKKPDGDSSRLLIHAVTDDPVALRATSDNFRFVSAVGPVRHAAAAFIVRRRSFFQEKSLACKRCLWNG